MEKLGQSLTIRMIRLECPFPLCNESVENEDKEIAIAVFNAHVSTHTTPSRTTAASSSNVSSRSEKLTRPKLSQGMLEESWNSFMVLWNLYKSGAGLSTSECSLQLIYCCDQELMEQVIRADPDITKKSEEDQLKSIRKLAVVPVAMGVRRSELLNLSQDVGEPSRAFLSRVQGKAATCNFTVRCEENCCNGGEQDKLVNFTPVVVKYVLVNGLADAEIRREILGWKNLDSATLVETISFLEQKEMARDAFRGEAAGVRSSTYRQQLSDEQKLKKKVKCGSCDTQIQQYARSRSGKIGERKYCLACWSLRKKELKKLHKDGSGKANEDDHKPDEASTMFTMACEISDQGLKQVRRRKVVREEFMGVEVTRNGRGCTLVVENHIFDNVVGWIKREAWKQPMLRLKAFPCSSMYSRLSVTVPSVKETMVEGIADTGAQICLWGLSAFYKAGFKKSHLIKVKQRIVAANRQPVNIAGAVFLSIGDGQYKTNVMIYVTPDVNGLYLSRQALTELMVIPKSFPKLGDAKPMGENISSVDAMEVGASSGVTTSPCGCLQRTDPPSRPAKLPFTCTPENIPKMKEWLLGRYASSTFNKCTHQSLPFIKSNPMQFHVDPDAKPVAHHTPAVLPIYWREKVKAGLDADERLGVIEKVPDGVPTTWLHRMVVVAKPNGEPRRTVDLSPLNSHCKRETHVTVPPFRQARLIPANTWKTVTDAWNGFHSALIREEDKHYTTFITDWGRYRYRVAPQGYVSSTDGYCKRYDQVIEPVARKAKVTDDTALWDSGLEEHWWRIIDYLELVGKNGIVLNGEKFQFCEKTVDFAGFRVSSEKVEPLPKYLKAIETFPTPRNISDVRSWFGLVNQVAHYAQLKELVMPLKPLLSSKSQFYWSDALQKSFDDSKLEIVNAIKEGVEIFDPSLPTKLHTDYSKTGLGFYLAQKHCVCPGVVPDCCEDGWRITLAGSRFLKAAEVRYVPLEGECLGVAWALEQTRYFTLGCPNLVVVVDHKPLCKVLGDKELEDITNARLFKMKERTLPWQFTVVYRPGKLNYFADGTSRNPGSQTDDIDENSSFEEVLSLEISAMLTSKMDPVKAITFELVQTATKGDEDLQKVMRFVETGFPEEKVQCPLEVQPFWNCRSLLSIVADTLLYGSSLVIPKALRPAVLEILGSAHQGVQAMRDRAADTLYWPGMHEDITRYKKSCVTCQRIAPSQPHAPRFPPEIPSMPFESIAADYFDFAGRHYLVIVDRLSGWIEVMKAPVGTVQSGAKGLCEWLRQYMARFGVPVVISSDGGPEFVAKETQNFMKRWGIKHRLSSAYLAQSNGRAEASVKAMKRLIHDNIAADGSIDNDKFVRAMLTKRNTPDQYSKLSPAEVVMGKKLRDNLPMIPKTLMVMNNPSVHPEWRSLWYQKESVMRDRCCKDLENVPSKKSKLQPLQVGQKVLIQNQTGKYPLRWDKSGTVGEVFPYDQYVIKVDGSNRLTRRNRRFLRAYKPAVSYDLVPNVNMDEDEIPEPDWGARGVGNRSKPSEPLSSGPGEHVVPPAVVSDSLPSLENSSRRLQDDNAGETMPCIPDRSPGPTVPVSKTVVRKSARANRGKTSRFEDFITGQGLEGIGE